MKVLVVGSGGREHALTQKIANSPLVDTIYCAPGNGGTAKIAINVNLSAMDFNGLSEFAIDNQIDLTVVGMDEPLVSGIVDVFKAKNLKIFGPSKAAALIEGSKAFSKDLMKKYNIPTAFYEVFYSQSDALDYLKSCTYPIVLKADGLALGKGVLICNSFEEAADGVMRIMEEKEFGSAGDKLVIEEFMEGREVSVLAFCDGDTILPMTSAQDHKRAYDNDLGPNTGGMGTFSPSPFYTKEIEAYCNECIYKPTIQAMKAEGREFVGILFVGLMLTKDGPKVLEYNARFGDPETQVVLPRMKNDIVPIFLACIDKTLNVVQLEFEDNAAVCVVLASNGYPKEYKTGFEISGLDNFDNKDYFAFHAGTKLVGDKIISSGGRVLGVTALGNDLVEARKNTYAATDWVSFENKYMRNDIGKAIM